MDFILMLTRNDRTVTDCLEVIEAISDRAVKHIGFKDIGVEPAVAEQLVAHIKSAGATSYLELVSTDRDSALNSARRAVEFGVDCLLGGTWIEETLAITSDSQTGYYPFVGRPQGHPTFLTGSPEQVAADCRAAASAGCAGVDLLAYRSQAADPAALLLAARAATPGRLIVAGSVRTAVQIQTLRSHHVDAFTIGSALFAAEFDPAAALLDNQLAAVERLLECHPSATDLRSRCRVSNS
jgi:hypothetical protein